MPPPIIQAPFVGNDGRPLIEPGAFYLDGDYSLRVNSWNSLAGVAIAIRVRMIRASDGELVDSDFAHTPNTNRTKATNDFPLPAGFILNITAFASAGAPLIGQTFVQVQLTRGLTGATLLLATILQDYLTAVQALAYPGSPIRSSIEGGGVTLALTGTTPGAGANIAETVPAGARWRLLDFSFVFTTSAAVVNRRVNLTHTYAPGRVFLGANTQDLAASLAGSFSYGGNLNTAVDAVNWIFQLPFPIDLELIAGAIIATNVNNLQAADQFNQVRYVVREWLEVAA